MLLRWRAGRRGKLPLLARHSESVLLKPKHALRVLSDPSDQPELPSAAGRRLNKMMSVQLVRLSAATAAANDDTVQVRSKTAVVAP